MLTSTEIHKYRAMLQNARTPEEAVMMEQLRAITQNIPALYIMLSVSVMTLGQSFRGVAPDWLSLGVPVAVILVSVIRVFSWRGIKNMAMDPKMVRRALLQQELTMVFLYFCMGMWVWLLLPYADRDAKTSLTFFTAFTGAVSTLCALSRPRVVAVSLALTLFVYGDLFLRDDMRFYPFVWAQIATTYVVFIMASRSYKYRLVQSVALLNRLNAENRRSTELVNSNRSMALSDMLTGLPNRRQFFQEVD